MTADAIRCKHCRAPYIPPVSRPDWKACMACTLGGPKAGKLALQLAAVERLPPMEQPHDGFAFRVPGQPLTFNHAHNMDRNGRKYLSEKGVEYRRVVAAEALKARPRGWRLDRPKYHIRIVSYFMTGHGDSDGPVKLVRDALQGVVYCNDVQARGSDERFTDKHAPRLEVTIEIVEAGRVG